VGRSDRVTGPLQAIASSARFRLLILGDNAIAGIHVLPETGTVTIGRDPDNVVQIEDDSISRHHAILHVENNRLSIEDAGSSNGTTVRKQPLAPNRRVDLGVNELVTVGHVTLVVQPRFAPAQTSRLATQDYFQTRLEEECARAERTNAQFAVLGIRAQATAENAVTHALMTTMRQSDVLARLGERSYALLVLDATPEQAAPVAERMVAAIRQVGGAATHSLAHFPSDARSAFALLTLISDHEPDPDELVIEEQSMRDLYALARRIAVSDLSVLILGETGVGKEKLSRTIHESSSRSAQRFVAINCAALNESLLESELFGHERGAFTGANSTKAGLLETADGGTVFLDEIGDMSLSIQSKILRILEDGDLRRVGATTAKKISVRFVAATNVDLEAAVERGRFRSDLYFRLSAATLVIPPLRERPREIVILARRFAAAAAQRMGRAGIGFTGEALELLRAYGWPGNIRELRNVIERAVVVCNNDLISDEDLPAERMRGTYLRLSQTESTSRGGAEDERERVMQALAQADGNQSKAASLLGVSRRTLINRLEQYNLPRPRKKRDNPE
jgi:transcriptional regulator with PAS, ATPase and Fis domain